MLNPLPCGEIAAGSAPQGGTKRGARGKPREFSVICYRLKAFDIWQPRKLSSWVSSFDLRQATRPPYNAG